MTDRGALADRFLAEAGWGTARRSVVAGDASNRRYDRLVRGVDSAILMDAPPDKGEDVRPFVAITDALRAAGLSAPEIFAQDTAHGFLLLEDLGDALFARVMAQDPKAEGPLYAAAVDVLVHLHQRPAPDLPAYDAATLTDLACLAFDWYQRGARGTIDAAARAACHSDLSAAFAPLDAVPRVLVQRDYHAENLIWLPERTGVARVGLLDYQDAMAGHPAYDLVSVLQDARRDVAEDVAAAMVDRYVAATGTEVATFRTAYALLGLQRNLRILGVFARLSMAYGKPHYVDLIPRVWGHIETNLRHPALARLAPRIRATLPAPTPQILQTLKDKCATIPLP